MNESKLNSIIDISGVPVIKTWKLLNEYWGSNDKMGPWWLLKTPFGMVRIGWRKRVIEINWEDTDIRKIITDDDVTKGETYVHAWSELKAVEYLQTLNVEGASLSPCGEPRGDA